MEEMEIHFFREEHRGTNVQIIDSFSKSFHRIGNLRHHVSSNFVNHEGSNQTCNE